MPRLIRTRYAINKITIKKYQQQTKAKTKISRQKLNILI